MSPAISRSSRFQLTKACEPVLAGFETLILRKLSREPGACECSPSLSAAMTFGSGGPTSASKGLLSVCVQAITLSRCSRAMQIAKVVAIAKHPMIAMRSPAEHVQCAALFRTGAHGLAKTGHTEAAHSHSMHQGLRFTLARTP